jgi:putative tryptophan/tyrosine transport system substrate-binding protein
MMKQYKQGYSLNSKGLGLLLLASLIVGLFVSSCGAEETKTYRVGVLIGLPFLADVENGFKEGMAELGYVEGENIVYDVQITDFDISTYQSVLQQFVEDEVDLILVCPTEASIEAKTITEGTGIPVVFTYALVEGMGIVDSVQEPGGNVTGVRYPGPDLAALRYEMLRDIAPNLKSIVIPYQAGYPIVQPQLDAIYPVAEADGVTIIEVPANNAEELAAYLNGLSDSDAENISAFLSLAEPLATFPDAFAVLADFAEGRQIPIAGFYTETENYASIFGVTVAPAVSGELAAPLADKIFQDIDAGTIPVVSADPYIEVNYSMIQQLGFDAPDSLLAVADQVYR